MHPINHSRFSRPTIVILALILGLGMVGAAIAQAINANSDTQDPPIYAPGIAYGVIDAADPLNAAPGAIYPDDNPPQASLAPDAPTATFSYYFVSGATLTPRYSVSDYRYEGLGCVYFTSIDGDALVLNTDLQLPTGSEIKYLRLYFFDTNNPGYITGYISRYPPSQSIEDLVDVSSPSTGQPGSGFVVSKRITQTVDNENFPYLVVARPTTFNANLRICGLRVAYYAPEVGFTFMPLLKR